MESPHDFQVSAEHKTAGPLPNMATAPRCNGRPSTSTNKLVKGAARCTPGYRYTTTCMQAVRGLPLCRGSRTRSAVTTLPSGHSALPRQSGS